MRLAKGLHTRQLASAPGGPAVLDGSAAAAVLSTADTGGHVGGAAASSGARAAHGGRTLTVLTTYLVLLELVPSSWVVPALGAVGTPSNIFALVMLLWYVGSWLVGRFTLAPETRSPRVAMCFLAASMLLAYMSLGQSDRAPIALETQAADRGLIGLVAWIGVVVVSSAGIGDYETLQRLLRRAVLMASAVGGLGIYESFTKSNPIATLHIPGLTAVSSSDDYLVRAGLARPSSTASHPLELAGVLTMMLPFAIQQAFDPARRGRVRKWLPVALIGGMVPLTVSRTSIIGLLVALLFLIPTWSRSRRWGALGVIALGSAGAKFAVPGLGTTVVNMFSALLGGGDNSTQARTQDYGGVAQYIEQRLWFGRGYGTFIPSLYRFTDNMYLHAVIEIGVFGTAAIVALYLVGYRNGRAGRKLAVEETRRELGQCFATAMVVAAVVSATFDSLTFPMFAGIVLFLLGCSGAYLGIVRRESEAGPIPTAVAAPPPAVLSTPATALISRVESVSTADFVSTAESVSIATPEARPAKPGPEPEPAGLVQSVRTGVRWSLINSLVIRIGTFLTGIVLARGLLTPRDWGLYAIGLTALAVLLSANELGVSLAVVRWDGEVRQFAPTVVTLSVAFSSALYVALFAAAPALASTLHAPDAAPMLRVLGLSVVVDGITCVPMALLTRQFAQRTRMVIDFVNFFATTALTLALAVLGFGAMSFAWGSLAGHAVVVAGCAIAAPGMMRPGWNREQARRLLVFGLPLAGASLLVLAMLNVDSLVIGATLGPVQLGLYQIAFNVSSWPVRAVSEVARRVSFAGFSRVANAPEALARSFGRGLELLMAAAVPACVILTMLPKPLLHVIYGDKWTSASGALRFLALLGLLRVSYELAYDCLVAVGKRRALLIVQGWWLAALVPVLIYAARTRGIAGVGFGHMIVAGPLVAPLFVWALGRGGVPARVVLRACARPFLGGAAMAGVCYGVGRLNLGYTATLLLAGILATAVYVPFVWPLRTLVRGGPDPT
ncbi:MAG TPA: oligosaccharide flippase family protein [Actinocrinis sp.]|uniref:oligosaccharide flippase family protein n=1 Tax=Actinocrinis sp. TaxID=1920516 RepID=UPI002DDCA8AA|nr:oligosaccharide flippase family protein [Actinocrinis sp.]HEV3170524.1 oligosaccharide flippase family protein [Actinocrinis sp.]